MFTTTVCVIFLIMYTQTGSLVSLKIKTSMSTERSILNISVLGLLAHSVSFCTDFTVINCHLYCTPAKWTFSGYGSKSFWIERSYLCCGLCQMHANSYWKKTGWPTSMGSWNLDDPPLKKGSKADDPAPLCSSPPPQYFLTSPLREFDYKAFHRILVTNEELKLSGTIRYAFNVKILIQ